MRTYNPAVPCARVSCSRRPPHPEHVCTAHPREVIRIASRYDTSWSEYPGLPCQCDDLPKPEPVVREPVAGGRFTSYSREELERACDFAERKIAGLEAEVTRLREIEVDFNRGKGPGVEGPSR